MKYLVAVLIIGVVTCCQQPKENAQARLSELDSYLQTQFPANEPGGAVLIMRGTDTLISKGYGLADMGTKERITAKTLFNLGSISKTFVANAILMLQERGQLSVEDSLLKYFPNFRNKALAKKIRIKHLLTHTSGLPDNRRIKQDSVFYLTAKDEENWFPVSQADSLVFEPGTNYEYSNPAFNALAIIVEQVSGMKWQKFVEDNIMKPSGMTASTITDGPHPASGVSHAYLNLKSQWVEKDYGEEPTFAAAGNGGVWSNVIELEKYEEALEKGTWLKRSTIADSRAIHQPANWRQSNHAFIGWSWFVGSVGDTLSTVGHLGTQGGFICNYVIVPRKKIHLFILCNTPRDIEAMTENLLKIAAK